MKSKELNMNKTLVITLFSAAAFVVGCKPSATDSTSANTVHAAADKVEDKAKDASQATEELTQAKKEYAYAQKTEYVAYLRSTPRLVRSSESWIR